MSVRAAEQIAGLHRDTICKSIVYFDDACNGSLTSGCAP